MRTRLSRRDAALQPLQPLRRHLPRGSRRHKLAIAGTAVAVLAGSGLAVDQSVGHAAAAAAQPHSALAPVTSFSPPGLGWDTAPPTVPATAGTPLSLLTKKTAAGAAAVLTLKPEAFNALTLRAYVTASQRVAAQDPGCGITWQMLAGIGRIESDNGRDVAAGGGMTANGTITPPILGPALNGKNGFAAIRDGQGWAHATGPFQFIPSTWQSWGADGNGDGTKDANNIFDASLGAAHYLCAGGRQLTNPKQFADAIYSYNHSRQYVQLVLQLVAGYSHESAASLLKAAQLQRLPAGTTVVAAPVVKPAASTWQAPALTGRVVPGGAVSLHPLAHAPAAARTAAVEVITQPRRGSAVVLGSTVVFHAPTGVVGTETFRYAVAGHGSATASIRIATTVGSAGPKPTPTGPAPTSTMPAPPPAGPSGTFAVMVKAAGTSLDLSGTDAGHDTGSEALTLTSSWTFALKPAATSETATLVLPAPVASPSPSPAVVDDQDWQISQTWSANGLDYVLIDAITACAAGQRCTAAGGPASVGVEDGRFTRASHDLTVADSSTISAAATATTALPLSGTQLKLQAKTY